MSSMYLRRLCFLLPALLFACAVGPDYKKPEAPVPIAFKEGKGWKLASPADLAPRGEWWQMYCDTMLNELVAQVNINNQNVKAAEAAYRQAHALLAQSRASFFPAISATAEQSRGRTAVSGVNNSYTASATASWEVDVWGRIRREYESQKAEEAASISDLEAARLSAQAELVINYLSLRVADEQKRLLQQTVDAYGKSLTLTENLYNDGLQTRSDYLQAKVQLQTARAQMVDVDVQRSAYEHAIAVLTGKAPADFELTAAASVPQVPLPPLTLPSVALERRPDVASAERRMAAANARIGAAQAAYFPDFTLSSAIGFTSKALSRWFTEPARVWSLGPSAVLSVFDAGFRRAQTAEAVAAYDASVAEYRQTVLSALQEVEDNLSALNALNEEQDIRDGAADDAKASTEVISNQYKAGITSYLNVATAQTAELNNALSALSVRKQRLVASVNLIKALGGKWEMQSSPQPAPEPQVQPAATPLQPAAEVKPKPVTLLPPKAEQ